MFTTNVDQNLMYYRCFISMHTSSFTVKKNKKKNNQTQPTVWWWRQSLPAVAQWLIMDSDCKCPKSSVTAIGWLGHDVIEVFSRRLYLPTSSVPLLVVALWIDGIDSRVKYYVTSRRTSWVRNHSNIHVHVYDSLNFFTTFVKLHDFVN